MRRKEVAHSFNWPIRLNISSRRAVPIIPRSFFLLTLCVFRAWIPEIGRSLGWWESAIFIISIIVQAATCLTPCTLRLTPYISMLTSLDNHFICFLLVADGDCTDDYTKPNIAFWRYYWRVCIKMRPNTLKCQNILCCNNVYPHDVHGFCCLSNSNPALHQIPQSFREACWSKPWWRQWW